MCLLAEAPVEEEHDSPSANVVMTANRAEDDGYFDGPRIARGARTD